MNPILQCSCSLLILLLYLHSNINHHNLIKINSINFIWTEEEKQKKKRTEKRMSY